MRKALLIFASLSLVSCAGSRNIVTTPPAACANLLPDNWAEGIEGAAIPDVPAGATVLQVEQIWSMAFIEQAGQLAKANGRTADAIGIFSRCETMVNASRPR